MSLIGHIVFLDWSTRDDRGAKVHLYDFVDYWLMGGRTEFDIGLIARTDHILPVLQFQKRWVYWAMPLLLIAMPIVRMSHSGVGWFDCTLLAVGVLTLLQQLLMRFWTAGLTRPISATI